MRKDRIKSENITLLIGLFFNGWLLYSKFVFNWPGMIILPLGLAFISGITLRGAWLTLKGAKLSAARKYFLPFILFLIIACIPRIFVAKIEYRIRAKDFEADTASATTERTTSARWGMWGNWAERSDYFIYSIENLPQGKNTKIKDSICQGETRQLNENYYAFFETC
jgi:hypothetical protein